MAPIPVLPENSRRMMRFATILGALLMSFSAVAQVGQGTLKGRVTDFDSKDALPFASVVLFLNGNQVAGTNTDFDGEYTIKPIQPGTYDVPMCCNASRTPGGCAHGCSACRWRAWWWWWVWAG